jgi:hypothetical protein
MLRKFPYYLLLLCVILACPIHGAAAPSRKPLPPLRVSIAPVQPGITSDRIKAGDIIEFKVTALSSIEVPELSIKVDLVGGTDLISGDTFWSGSAAKNEERSITLTIRAPKSGQGRIRVRVSIPPSGGPRFFASAEYVLGPVSKFKPEQEHPVKKDSKGRSVIEYR